MVPFMDERSIAPLISGVFIGIVFLLLMQGVVRSKHLGDCEKRSKQLCAEVVAPITVDRLTVDKLTVDRLTVN